MISSIGRLFCLFLTGIGTPILPLCKRVVVVVLFHVDSTQKFRNRRDSTCADLARKDPKADRPQPRTKADGRTKDRATGHFFTAIGSKSSEGPSDSQTAPPKPPGVSSGKRRTLFSIARALIPPHSTDRSDRTQRAAPRKIHFAARAREKGDDRSCDRPSSEKHRPPVPTQRVFFCQRMRTPGEAANRSPLL